MGPQELQKRIEVLEKQIASLNQSSTISYQVENAFLGRGFLQERDFVIGGFGTLDAGGEYQLVIPGANATSIPMVSYITTVGGELEASIIPSVSSPGQYEIYVQGNATETFNYLVFLTKNNYTTL